MMRKSIKTSFNVVISDPAVTNATKRKIGIIDVKDSIVDGATAKTYLAEYLLLLLFIFESSLKTVVFGLKPGNCLVFNSPVRQLSVGAIDIHDIQGFSYIYKFFITFLDWALQLLRILGYEQK